MSREPNEHDVAVQYEALWYTLDGTETRQGVTWVDPLMLSYDFRTYATRHFAELLGATNLVYLAIRPVTVAEYIALEEEELATLGSVRPSL